MDHNLSASPSSSPVHYHKDFVPRNNNNSSVSKSNTGDNISQLSQPNSDISSLSAAADAITAEKYQRLAGEFAKVNLKSFMQRFYC